MSSPQYQVLHGRTGPTLAMNIWANASSRDLHIRYSTWLKSVPLTDTPPMGVFGDGCLRILWNGREESRPCIRPPGPSTESEILAGLAKHLGGALAPVTPLNRVFIPLPGSKSSDPVTPTRALAKTLGFLPPDHFPVEFCGVRRSDTRWEAVWSLGMMVYLAERVSLDELAAILAYVPPEVTGDIYATLSKPNGESETHLFVRM